LLPSIRNASVHVDARGAAGEVAHVGCFPVRQLDGRDRTIHVEHAVSPDDAALFVDEREAAVVDVVHDPEIAALHLFLAIESHVVESAGRVRAGTRRVRRVRAVFDAIAVVGERVEALAVVLLHTFEVRVGDFDQLLT